MCDTINLIRSLLRAQHMTVAQLSYDSHIPVARLYRIFNRRTTLTLQDAIRISQALHITVDQLAETVEQNNIEPISTIIKEG